MTSLTPVTEPSISINGTVLSAAQAAACRLAIRNFVGSTAGTPPSDVDAKQAAQIRRHAAQVEDLMLSAPSGPRDTDDANECCEPPANGWTCFHCGETFKKLGSARDHFGTTPAGVPGCIIKAGEELGLLMALRRAETERDAAIAAKSSLEMQVEAARNTESDVLRLVPGAKSRHDVWCHLETQYGRAHTAEALLAHIEKSNPELVREAQVAVCGPGTYYPIGSGVPLDRPNQELRGPLEAAMLFIDSEFRRWWHDEGQFIRAGGGDYEQTFAYRAWESALKQASRKLRVESHRISEDDEEVAYRQDRGAMASDVRSARVLATLRGVINTLDSFKRLIALDAQTTLFSSRDELMRLLPLFQLPSDSETALS